MDSLSSAFHVLAVSFPDKRYRPTYSDLPVPVRILPISHAAGRHHLHGTRGTCLLQQELIMKFINIATLVLVIVGAVNWGLMGFFQFDLVATLFGGPQATISRIVYGLVGLAGLYQLVPLAAALSGTAENPQLATSARH
jgi:uncharacterized protein